MKWDKERGIVDDNGNQVVQILETGSNAEREYYGKLLLEAIKERGTYEQYRKRRNKKN